MREPLAISFIERNTGSLYHFVRFLDRTDSRRYMAAIDRCEDACCADYKRRTGQDATADTFRLFAVQPATFEQVRQHHLDLYARGVCPAHWVESWIAKWRKHFA